MLTDALAGLSSANASLFSADGVSIFGGYDSDKQEAFLTVVVEGKAGISASTGNQLLTKPTQLLQQLGSSLQGLGIGPIQGELQLSAAISADIQARVSVTLGYKVASIADVLTNGYVLYWVPRSSSSFAYESRL